MTSNITILSVESPPQRKTFFLDANGVLKKRKPDFPLYSTKREREVSCLGGLFNIIKTEAESGCAVILRGQYLPDAEIDALEANRRKKVAELGEKTPDSIKKAFVEKRLDNNRYYLRRNSLIVDAPCPWVCFDFDDFRPAGVTEARFDVANPRSWVDAAIEQELGPDFVGVDYILQLSSSAGLPKSKDIRCHVWFWLDRGLDGFDWKAWYAARTEVLGRPPKIDKGMFQASRVHYIAPPLFTRGAFDPVLDCFAERITYCEGIFSDRVTFSDWSGIVTTAEEARAKAASRKVDVLDGDDAEAAREAWERPGVVGAFNRAYPMSAVINTFLSPYYKIDSEDGRVTWLRSPSGSVGSCRIVAGNTRMFNTSSSDPLEGYVGSAFDHIEALLFDGDYHEAARWALEQPGVQEEMDKALNSEFDEWVEPPKVAEIELPVEGDEAVVKKVTTAEDVAAEYPMPSRINGKEVGYKSEDGDWWFGLYEDDEDDEDEGGVGKKGKKKKKGGGKKGGFRRLWSPITVIGYMCDNRSDDLTVEIKVMGPNGQPQHLSWQRGMLSRRKEVEQQLLNKGWRAKPREMAHFLDYLQDDGGEPIRTVGRGWETVPGGRVFTAPTGEVLGAPEGAAIRLKPGLGMRPEVVTKGTLEGWKEALETHLAGEMVSLWALGVAAGFCGPLVQVSDFATPALWISGASRSGKSLSLRLAVSAWANPFTDTDDKSRFKDQECLFRTMNATSNSLEIVSALANGTVLALDESGSKSEKEQKDLATFIYNLVSGKGKERMTQDASALRASFTWEAFAICTAEHSPQHIVRAAKGAPLPQGTLSRMLPIHIPELKNESETAARGRAFHDALKEHHGLAGVAFVRSLVEKGYTKKHLLDRHHAVRKELLSLVPRETAVISTAVGTFALLRLAGDLAREFDIIGPVAHAAIVDGVAERWHIFNQGEAGKTLGEDAIERIDEWVAAHWANFVKRGEEERVGYAGAQGWAEKQEGDTWVVYLSAEKLVEASGGAHEAKRLGNMLRAAGRIAKKDNGRAGCKVGWAAGRPRAYAITIEAPDEGSSTEVADIF